MCAHLITHYIQHRPTYYCYNIVTYKQDHVAGKMRKKRQTIRRPLHTILVLVTVIVLMPRSVSVSDLYLDIINISDPYGNSTSTGSSAAVVIALYTTIVMQVQIITVILMVKQ